MESSCDFSRIDLTVNTSTILRRVSGAEVALSEDEAEEGLRRGGRRRVGSKRLTVERDSVGESGNGS